MHRTSQQRNTRTSQAHGRAAAKVRVATKTQLRLACSAWSWAESTAASSLAASIKQAAWLPSRLEAEGARSSSRDANPLHLVSLLGCLGGLRTGRLAGGSAGLFLQLDGRGRRGAGLGEARVTAVSLICAIVGGQGLRKAILRDGLHPQMGPGKRPTCGEPAARHSSSTSGKKPGCQPGPAPSLREHKTLDPASQAHRWPAVTRRRPCALSEDSIACSGSQSRQLLLL